MAEKSFRIDADVSPFEEAMLRAQQAAARSAADIKAQFEQLNAGFNNLKTAVNAVVSAFAGGEIAAKLGEMAERAEGMRKSSEIFNMSTTALQGLEVMANRTGVSSEYLQRAMATLEQRMRTAGENGGTAAERFNALGITTQELRDPTFSVQDAMERLGVSTNSSSELLAALGGRSRELIPLMRELARNHQAAAEAAKEAGALTEEEIAILSRYHGQITIVKTEWENFASRLLSVAAPALSEMQQQLFNILTAGEKTGDLAQTARNVAAEFLKWAAAAKQLAEDLTYIFTVFGTHLGAMGAEMTAVLHGNFAQAKAITDAEMADLTEIRKNHEARILANHEALAKALLAIDLSVLQPVDVTAKYKGGELPDLSNEFEKRQKFLESWASEYQSITTRNVMSEDAANARIDKLDKEALKAKQKVEELKAQAAEEQAVGEVDAREKALGEELKDGEVSAAQYLAQENALITERLNLLKDFYAKKAADAGEDEVKQAEVQVEITRAEAAATKQRQVAANTARQAELAQWQQLGKSMESSFASNLTGMIEGTRTATQAIHSLFQTLINGIIQIFVKMAIQWAENLILGKIGAAEQITANAGVAATAAMGSVAAIPIYGWAAAPAVGAATFAEALGYVSATAQGGYDIPSNINPIVQTHAREMILPADIAENIRAMTDGSGVGEQHNYNGHVSIQALDARSLNAMLSRPGARRAVSDAVRRHYQRGGR